MQQMMITQNLLLERLRQLQRIIARSNNKLAVHLLHTAAIACAHHLKADNLPERAVRGIKQHHLFKIALELLLKAEIASHSLLQAFHERRIFVCHQLIEKLLLIAKIFIYSALAHIRQCNYLIKRCLFIAMARKNLLCRLQNALVLRLRHIYRHHNDLLQKNLRTNQSV